MVKYTLYLHKKNKQIETKIIRSCATPRVDEEIYISEEMKYYFVRRVCHEVKDYWVDVFVFSFERGID